MRETKGREWRDNLRQHGADSKEKNGRESVFLAVFCCVMTCGYGKMKRLTEQSGEIQWQGKVTV